MNPSRLFHSQYKFPKTQIFDCNLYNHFWDKISFDLEMYMKNTEFNLSDFGAWSTQFRANINSESHLEIPQLVDDLIGIKGMSHPSRDEVLTYKDYFRSQQKFPWRVNRLLKDFFLTRSLLTDLGSVVDLSIIKSLIPDTDLNVLEIGGGYGRLVEAAYSNMRCFKVWYMVDVIPSSLSLAGNYLDRNQVPVGLSQSTDCVRLLQLHNLDSIRDSSIDLAINIESFQEMTQDYVDFWLSIVNIKCSVGAVFYQSNSFNYKNQFSLRMSSDWSLERSLAIPRHWSEGHRTEIWRKIR
jgi:hypothetical protein